MTTLGRLIVGIVLVVIVAIAAVVFFAHRASLPASTVTSSTATTTASGTYGMSEYTDPTYGFSFWYPSSLTVAASSTNDDESFPGGVAVETVSVGSAGGVEVIVINSASSTITDEPNGHASPINQTKYFYDGALGAWMVAYPEGSMTGEGGATTTADVSKMTIGELPMLASGRRFDTTIVPLSPTQFIVVTDGGGSSFTPQLAQTVAQVGAPVDASAQAMALAAEAAAYAQANSK